MERGGGKKKNEEAEKGSPFEHHTKQYLDVMVLESMFFLIIFKPTFLFTPLSPYLNLFLMRPDPVWTLGVT